LTTILWYLFLDMPQQYKSVYFVDCPGAAAGERNVTLAFGEKDSTLFDAVKPLTSQEIRELIGHESFAELRESAAREQLRTNTYCVRQLRARLTGRSPSRQLDLLPDLARQLHPIIDPVQATYRGGQTEPLHDWYPYLEGYSPKFVEQVIQEFAPRASRILDPFAGMGTTPLTTARLGGEGYYCEINPLLQFLVETKTFALRLGEPSRRKAADSLRELSDDLGERLRGVPPDEELGISYDRTFGPSRFFDGRTFEQVLAVRTFVDRFTCENALASRFVTLAALASLLPASNLIRRGDIRYKTAEETRRHQVGYLTAITERLKTMSADLAVLPSTSMSALPIMVCEDARKLDRIDPLDVEAVVTSPPYLNGTNYFRNTKLELWFLRCLRRSNDLAGFRLRAVTAGINDVTVAKSHGERVPESAGVVRHLETSCYDGRIPRMVAGYFSELETIFRAICKHLAKNATLVIDIGDSSYANVHVPTDEILAGILKRLGFTFRRNITLRRRLSRSGFPLRQTLLVFDWPTTTRSAGRGPQHSSSPWAGAWQNFKTHLPHHTGTFRKRNWGHPLHSLCSYQGKMKPSLAYHLVTTFAPRGGTLLDPFAGVGTIPFEAALQGVATFSFEISPAALQISRAKLGVPKHNECRITLDALQSYLRDQTPARDEYRLAREIRINGPLPDYFDTRTFREILLARQYFRENPPRTASDSLVFASLLHILHGNRPYALSRRSHPITPFAPTGPAEYRALLGRLSEKVARSLEAERPADFLEGRVLCQDATAWWPQEVDQLDCIITSPPFFDSTRFYLANWMRLWFCGWDAKGFKSHPLAFVDERQKQGFEVYAPVFRQARERLRLGGVMVLHLGKSRKCDMARQLEKVAARWFRVADLYTEGVAHCESHGIRDKGTVTDHQFLVLQ
jgi:hypothetical protein